MDAPIPAGWYPDPAGSPGLRWWDGAAWTSQVSEATPHGARFDLEEEAKRARWARMALLVAIPAQVAGGVLFRVNMHDFVDRVRDRTHLYGGRLAVPTQLAGVVGTVVGVLFLLWFAKAAANAEALGLPARREPAAGVAGFLVPVINLWWPYQSVCDLFPPGDPRRPLVLRWFLLWMVGGLVGTVVLWMSVFVDGAAGWLLLAVPAVLTTLAAVSARQVVAESVEAHGSLARVRRL